MDLVKSFVIGSSAFTFVPFYLVAKGISERKYPIQDYAVKASLYFGTMNALSLVVGRLMGWTLWERLFLINIVSILFITSWITYHQSYAFESRDRWLFQYFLIILGHSIIFLVVIYGLEKAL